MRCLIKTLTYLLTYLTLWVLNNFFYFVHSAEYAGLYCIMLQVSVDFYQRIPR